MTADADIVILGAGCAGLSLAVALAGTNLRRRVLLLEPREAYVRDRTWCFWNTEPHPFTAAISHRWDRWRVSCGSDHAVQQSDTYAYCHIDGGDFYRHALDRIEAAPGQEICLGVRALETRPAANGLHRIETNLGQLTASMVFDSRPPSAPLQSGPTLVQRFAGWHIRSERPIFDPETVELMRFLPSVVSGRIRFLYLLPFSPTESLVEMTYLDRPEFAPADAEADLKSWCDRFAGRYQILYREQGALPMGGSVAATAADAPYPIGIRGGRLKPSSGYGFLRMQRHSRAIANALAAGAPLPSPPEPAFYRHLDALFLRALSRSPQSAPALFLGLFARTEPDALVRFLSERSGLLEALRVALHLPRVEMLRSLARRAPRGTACDQPIAGME